MTQDHDEVEPVVLLAEMRTCNGTTIAGGYVMHDRRCPVHGEPSESFAAKADREGFQRGFAAGQRWAIEALRDNAAFHKWRHPDPAPWQRVPEPWRGQANQLAAAYLAAAAEQTPTQPGGEP